MMEKEGMEDKEGAEGEPAVHTHFKVKAYRKNGGVVDFSDRLNRSRVLQPIAALREGWSLLRIHNQEAAKTRPSRSRTWATP